jgi:hypothetical protein
VHRFGLGALNKIRGPSCALEKRLDFLARDAGPNGGIVDLVSIQVQYGQHGPVANRVDEFVDVPTGGQGACFCLPISHHGGHDQVRVVEGCPARMGKHIAQFAPLVDAAWSFGGAVAADATWKRKLLEESPHAGLVFGTVWVHIAVGAFEVTGGQNSGSAMAGAGHEHHIEVVFSYGAAQMRVGESQPGACAPVAQQPVLHVVGLEWFTQERVGLQVSHSQGQIIAGTPITIDGGKVFRFQGRARYGGSGFPKGADGLGRHRQNPLL